MDNKSLEGFPEQFSKNVENADKQADFEKEREKDYLLNSKDCGVAAYAELTNKVPEHVLEKIYDRRGAYLTRTVRDRAMYFGAVNHKAGKYIENPVDYVQEFVELMKELQQKAEKAPPVTPEDMGSIMSVVYSYDGEGNPRFLNEKNYTQITFGGYRENYLEWIERVRRTLEGFGEAAKDAGDDTTYNLVQKALEETKQTK